MRLVRRVDWGRSIQRFQTGSGIGGGFGSRELSAVSTGIGSVTNDFSGIIDFRAFPGSSTQSVDDKVAITVAPPPYSKGWNLGHQHSLRDRICLWRCK